MATTMKLIAKTTLTSNATTLTLGSGGTIPQTFTDLLLVASARSTRAGDAFGDLMLRFNGDTGSNYTARYIQGNGSAASSGVVTTTGIFFHLQNASLATSNVFSSSSIYIPNYTGSTAKSVSIDNVAENNNTSAVIRALACLWTGTAAITSITLYDGNSANIVSDSSFYLYGITKA